MVDITANCNKVFLYLTKGYKMSTNAIVRAATASDLSQILDIVNESIRNTVAIYDYDERTLDDQIIWFNDKIKSDFPVLVATLDQTVVGFGSYGSFKAKAGYDNTVEHSVYVVPQFVGKGIGKLILSHLIALAKQKKLHVMIGYIDASNIESINFHKKFGFVESGHLKQVGYKFGKWLDVKLMQLMLE